MIAATHSPARLPWLAALAAAILQAAPAQAADARYDVFTELPPPPRHTDPDAEQRLELELVVNGLASGVIAPVTRQGGRFQLRAQDLRQAGLLLDTAEDSLFIDSLEGVSADYDAPRQQLHLTVSPERLPAQHLGGSAEAFAPAQQDTGALLNYDLYVSGGESAPFQASLWHEARLFGPFGLFSSTGALRSNAGRAYVRFDTTWRWSDERSMTTVEAGDIITRTLPWAPAIRLGGGQVSRDFSVRPDIVTYPLPEFAGSAALPSTVELVVNGQRIAGSQVRPGPFALDTLPPISGYGEANLIVTDMHGRSVATALPFYVSSILLRPGLADYSVAAGAFRRNYGTANFDYGRLAASASLRRGMTSGLTLEARAEATGTMRLLGAGAVFRLGNLGIVSTAYARSFHKGRQGGQLTLGYEYQARTFSLGLRHSRQDRHYADLGVLDRNGRQNRPECLSEPPAESCAGNRERSTAATASIAIGSASTLGIGYFDLQRSGTADARLANLSWALPLVGESRINASISRDFAERGWSGAITLTIPLGGGNLGTGVSRDNAGRSGLRADYSRAVPSDGGLGWSASAFSEGGGRPYLRGDVLWRAQPVQLRAGAYGRDEVTGWFGASGSLVFMDGSLFAANRVSDAFAVVSTDGEAGIPVRYENQLIGRTGSGGKLLVPSASAYYPAHYDIDTLSLSPNVKADTVSRRVAIAAGSGHVIRFPIERAIAVRATIADTRGEPLPAGTPITVNRKDRTYVGWDGMLFIDDASPETVLEAILPDGTRCHAAFSVPAEAEEIIDAGTLTCRS